MPAFPLPVEGLPAVCRYCGHEAEAWELSCHALQVILVCPSCHSRIGRLVAVPPAGRLHIAEPGRLVLD